MDIEAWRVEGLMEASAELEGIAERTAALEMALIREYLGAHPPSQLAPETIEQAWKDALLYAALRLEEIAARAHMIDGLHDRPRCM